MLFPSLWKEPEQPHPLSCLEKLNVCKRVGNSIHDSLPKPRIARPHPVLDAPMSPVGRLLYICNRAVLLPDQTFGKDPVVLSADIRPDGQEEKARRLAVQSVHWRQGVQAGTLLQTDQERSLHMVSNRSHRHPMRLVDNKNVVVAVNDARWLDRARFRWNLSPVKDKNSMA